MVENSQDKTTCRSAGYAALIERYDLDVIPNWHKSLVTASGIHRIDSSESVVEEVYPSKYWPEALFRFIDQTIDTELASELAFLASYDKTRKAIQEVIDMPDLKIDLFIRFCLQNNGRLSARKRASHFDFLSDEEIARMEQAVLAAYGSTSFSRD